MLSTVRNLFICLYNARVYHGLMSNSMDSTCNAVKQRAHRQVFMIAKICHNLRLTDFRTAAMVSCWLRIFFL